MAKSECKHLRVGREYLQSVKWPDTLRKPTHDRCYCKRCYPHSLADTLTVAGYTYVIPRGWTRFAVSVDEVIAKHLNVWDKWVNCYHGTSIENAKSAVEHRQLLLPSDVTLEGKKLAIREGHIPGEHYVFTTPSITYAALEYYAHTYPFISPGDSHAYTIKVVLQCKQKKSSIIVQPETVRARERQERICPHIPNEKLEWKTQHRSAVMIYGLMLEIKSLLDENEDPDTFQNQTRNPIKNIISEPISAPRQPPPPPPPPPFKPKVETISNPAITPTKTEDVVVRHSMTKTKIAILIVLILLTILPLVALIIGGISSGACPIQPWIPRWLVIFGAVGLATFGLIFFINLMAFTFCPNESHVERYISGCILCLLTFFFFAWLIAGSVWVFPYKATVQYDQSNAANYCGRTPYMFAFGLLLAQYVLVGISCCIGIVSGICIACTS